jgi:hypothetical protein
MNDKARMTKDGGVRRTLSDFVIQVSFVIRHSSFDISSA